ncbi:hypothetical protein ACSBR2_035779 [Camellia fascicularis]
MTMTSYDFSVITSFPIAGDPIPFDSDIRFWDAGQLYLLEAIPPKDSPRIIRYSWLYQMFHGTHPDILEATT